MPSGRGWRPSSGSPAASGSVAPSSSPSSLPGRPSRAPIVRARNRAPGSWSSSRTKSLGSSTHCPSRPSGEWVRPRRSRLHELGLPTVGDLARVPERVLIGRFGEAQGRHLAELAAARDDSPVEPDRPTKSVSHEETFGRDLHLETELAAHTARMAEAVAGHLRTSGLAARTVTVKVRFGDFSTLTRSHTLPFAIDAAAALGAVAGALAEAVDPSVGVRLLGVSASGLQAADRAQQLSFDLGPASAAGAETPPPGSPAVELQASWRELSAALDAIRRRFGADAVGAAAFLGDEGLAVPRRHGAQWGPSTEG